MKFEDITRKIKNKKNFNSARIYEVRFKQWQHFCQEKNVDPLEAQHLLDEFLEKFNPASQKHVKSIITQIFFFKEILGG